MSIKQQFLNVFGGPFLLSGSKRKCSAVFLSTSPVLLVLSVPVLLVADPDFPSVCCIAEFDGSRAVLVPLFDIV